MIKFSRPEEPSKFSNTAKPARTKIDNLVKAGKKPKSKDFDAEPWRVYKAQFEEKQHGKCAYCAEQIAGSQAGDVEHFRPKVHYWWLAYEWSNYLYACEKCNRWAKGDEFPVRGPKAEAAGEENAEKPLLVNPYDLDPAPHFSYAEDGTMEGMTVEGKETIKVCQLNHTEMRKYLIEYRREVAEDLRRDFDDFQNGRLAQKSFFERLRIHCQAERRFVGMVRYLASKWLHMSVAEITAWVENLGAGDTAAT